MKTLIPHPGTDVKLVLVEHLEDGAVRKTKVVNATVVDPYSWGNYPGTFCILIPGDPWPERLIHMKYVISINGHMVEGWNEIPKWATTWQVESNGYAGQFYTVSYDGQDWRCTCKGFAYHGHCTHVRKIQQEQACHT